ncbi:MAG TPA: hypothetical protein VE954_41215 [Oligoflexus sp.]|uniref:hypothetical protein n=1 Tax=Oligoflexus sp. TaxID=1971216 RepID=UPI002D6DE0E4|nr:hypothetical protein [Oligoflexus sp.]HYX39563.1 hypothetical protein [Oligoflexus sp.]
MFKMKTIFVSGTFLLCPACATTNGAMNTVMERATFDLNCDASQVKVVELSSAQVGYVRTMGASGCGRKVVYLVKGDGVNGYVATLNSPTGNQESSK